MTDDHPTLEVVTLEGVDESPTALREPGVVTRHRIVTVVAVVVVLALVGTWLFPAIKYAPYGGEIAQISHGMRKDQIVSALGKPYCILDSDLLIYYKKPANTMLVIEASDHNGRALIPVDWMLLRLPAEDLSRQGFSMYAIVELSDNSYREGVKSEDFILPTEFTGSSEGLMLTRIGLNPRGLDVHSNWIDVPGQYR
jgi:hypothetical protein